MNRVTYRTVSVLLLFISFWGCGNSNTPSDTTTGNGDTGAVTLQLDFKKSVSSDQLTKYSKAADKATICDDYLIFYISVSVIKVSDNSEEASDGANCSAGNITLNDIPANEQFYAICQGFVGASPTHLWEGKSEIFVVNAGQTKEVGPITMSYLGDDDAAPFVQSTTPGNSENVPINTSISIIFNERISQSAAITEGAVTLRKVDSAGENSIISGTLDYEYISPDLSVLKFTPYQYLIEDMTYEYTLNGNIMDTAGNTLTGEYQWQFHTGATINQLPSASITKPSDGEIFISGSTIYFLGSGIDPEDGQLSGTSLVWHSNIDSAICTGQNCSSEGLTAGTHTITLTATDSNGATAEDTVSIVVNTPPVANIEGISNGTVITTGDTLTINGSGTDVEDGLLSGNSLKWMIDDTQAATGGTFILSNLSAGTHEITLVVSDMHGALSTDTVTIRVNSPPTALIQQPEQNAVFTEGETVTLVGSGNDAEDGILNSNRLTWIFEPDTIVGIGNEVVIDDLQRGQYQCSLVVSDSDGATGVETLTFNINSTPTIEIKMPNNGSIFNQNDSILFLATRSDFEDGVIDETQLQWISSIDGPIATGHTFTTNTLSPGSHHISYTATDSDGASTTETITIVVNALPTVRINDPYDGETLVLGTSIQFNGTCSDIEDGTIPDENIIWESDKEGIIGTSPNIQVETIAAGTYLITLKCTDTNAAEVHDTIQIAVVGKNPIPDTGQVTSHTSTFGEDCDYMINPTSYSKLDIDGNILAADALSWAAVKDEITGLIWEIKTQDDSIHNKKNTYSWVDAQQFFLVEMNNEEYGGCTEWRLPTVNELSTIINSENNFPPIDTDYFPNTKSSDYWTSSPHFNASDEAWILSFYYGWTDYRTKSDSCYVRGVCGVKASKSYTVMDETVIDNNTGLMWQRGQAGPMVWEDALNHCETLNLSGYTDWRLPNRNELQSIVEYTAYDPATDKDVFFEETSHSYWTSTTDTNMDLCGEDAARIINLISGYGSCASKYESVKYFVRAVRGEY